MGGPVEPGSFFCRNNTVSWESLNTTFYPEYLHILASVSTNNSGVFA